LRILSDERRANMLSLKSFHLVLLGVAIILTAGVGAWGLLDAHKVLGGVSLAAGVLLVVYGGYFAGQAERIHLE
jgi:hypothetical protein